MAWALTILTYPSTLFTSLSATQSARKTGHWSGKLLLHLVLAQQAIEDAKRNEFLQARHCDCARLDSRPLMLPSVL
jgi:hypothetical protein